MKQFNKGEQRQLNVERIAAICKELRREYDESALYSVWLKDPMEAHIEIWGLHQIAPPSEWIWSLRHCDGNPHEAAVMVDGVKFFAIFTDEERQAVLDE